MCSQWQCKVMATIVGHIPRQVSYICMLFICRGGVLNCLITGSRWYSRDFPQGASYQEVCIDGAWNVRDYMFMKLVLSMKFVKISCLENFCLYSSCATFEKIDPQEGCLWLAQIYFVKRCKEENVKKMGHFSGTHISWTSMPIFFKLSMYVWSRIWRA